VWCRLDLNLNKLLQGFRATHPVDQLTCHSISRNRLVRSGPPKKHFIILHCAYFDPFEYENSLARRMLGESAAHRYR